MASVPVPRNVTLISAAFFFIFFGFGTAQQYLVILFTNQGRGHFALVSLLLLYGAFLLTGVAVAKLIPLFGGLRRSLLLGAFTYVIFVASVALENTFILCLTSILIGIGAGLLWVSSGQIITDSSDERTMGRNLAYQVIGVYSGNILGINIGAYLVRALSLESMYLLLAGSILLGLFFLPWIRPVKEELKPRPFRPYYLLDRKMLLLFPIVFGAYFLQAQVFTAMNLIVVNLLGIGAIALVVTVIKLSNIAGSFSIGKISGWYSKATVLSVLSLIALAGIFFFVGMDTLAPLLAGAVLLGFSMSAIYPVVLAWLKESIPSEEYLHALGVFHVYSNVGVLGAIATNIFLPSGASFIPGALALVVAFVGIAFFKRLPKTGEEATTLTGK